MKVITFTDNYDIRAFILALFFASLFILFPDFAYAAFDSSMCNVYNITTGTAGKAFATVSIASVGTGFYFGKVSWGLMIGTVTGIAVIFGAPSVVSAVSGQEAFECHKGSLITVCEDEGCFACPVGFSGENCDRCATGFGGANCDSCVTGYVGAKCDECDIGYKMYQGQCQKVCTASHRGIVTKSSDPGTKTVSCDKANFAGTITYSCINNQFSVIQDNCVCAGNFTGANCDSCKEGYVAPNCTECSTGYTKVDGSCEKDCKFVGVNGISEGSQAIPKFGSKTCEGPVFSGNINYSCIGGVLSVLTGSCGCSEGYKGEQCNECQNGYILNQSGECVTGQVCSGQIVGVVDSSKTFSHGSNNEVNCDAAGYSGKTTFYCNNGQIETSQPCYRGCSATVTGISGTIALNHGETKSVSCNETGFDSTKSASITCSDGSSNVTQACSCGTGYVLSSNQCVVKVESSCLSVTEGQSLTATAPNNGTWNAVSYANYGTPNSCVTDTNCSKDVSALISSSCVGKKTCTISISNSVMGVDPCSGVKKRINVKMSYN